MEDTLRGIDYIKIVRTPDVLILVLMEDTLRDIVDSRDYTTHTVVLILVLMEDTLRGHLQLQILTQSQRS